jgi:hypothetical protein
MHSPVIEPSQDAPGLREPAATCPAPKKSESSLSIVSASPLPSLEKSHAAHEEHGGLPRKGQSPNPFDTDLEAMITTDSRRRSDAVTRDDCQVWPGKEHWKRKAKEAKRGRRSCACMASLSRRTRIVVKISIALLIVGIAVAVGFGVSKPLGAPIWGDHSNEPN